jgi:hypothetical protein
MKLEMTQKEREAFIRAEESKTERWFAWYPVRLTDGSTVWLETVSRYKYFTNPAHRTLEFIWIHEKEAV